MEGFVTVDKGDLMEAVGMVTGHATVGMLLDDANTMARSLKHKGLMFDLGSAIDSNDAAFIKAEKVLLDMLDGKSATLPEPPPKKKLPTPRSEKRCYCGDPAYGDNGSCGPNGCFNVPA